MTIANRIIQITIKSIGANQAGKSVKDFGLSIKGLNIDLNKLATGGALTTIATGLNKYAQLSFNAGAQAERFRTTNDKLAASLGTTSDVLIAGVQQAANGTIGKLQALESTNKAMLFGIVQTQSEMESLTQIATTLGRATGQTTAKSFDDLVIALSRGSPLILDNLGISLKLSDAYEEYAATLGKTTSQLTNQEKQVAFLNVARQKGLDLTTKLGGVQNDALSEVENFTRANEDLQIAIGGLLTKLANTAPIVGFIERLEDGAIALSGVVDQIGTISSLIGSGEADLFGGAKAAFSANNESFGTSLFAESERIRQDALAAQQEKLNLARDQIPVEETTTDELRKQVELVNDIASIRSGFSQASDLFGGFTGRSTDGFTGDLSGIQQTTIGDDSRAARENADSIIREQERAAKETERLWKQQQNAYQREIEKNNNRLQSLIEKQLAPTLQEVWEAPADDRRIDENARRLADVAVKGFSSPWLKGLEQTFGGQEFFNPIVQAIESGDSGQLQQAANSILTSPALSQLWDIELVKERVRADLQAQNAHAELVKTVMQELTAEGVQINPENVTAQFGGLSSQLGQGLGKSLPQGFKDAKLGNQMLDALIKDLRASDAKYIELTKTMLQGIGNQMLEQIDIIGDALLDALSEKLSEKFGLNLQTARPL